MDLERRIIEVLKDRDASSDELARRLMAVPEKVCDALNCLEVSGAIDVVERKGEHEVYHYTR